MTRNPAPVAWRYKKSWEKSGWVICETNPEKIGIYDDLYTIEALHVTNLEPFSLVLPCEDTRRTDPGEDEAYQNGWNACLDEVTRLNMGNQSSMATKKNDR